MQGTPGELVGFRLCNVLNVRAEPASCADAVPLISNEKKR
jgi:hypothetical protein